jgi:hypothetical protein
MRVLSDFHIKKSPLISCGLSVIFRSIQANNAKLLHGAFCGGLTLVMTTSIGCVGVLASESTNSNSAKNLGGGLVKLDCDTKAEYLQTSDCSVGGDSGLQLPSSPILRTDEEKQPCRVQAGAGNNSFSDEYAYCVEIR